MVEVSRRELMVGSCRSSACRRRTGCRAERRRQAPPRPGTSPNSIPTDAAWEAERQAMLKAIPRSGPRRASSAEAPRRCGTAFQAQSDISQRAIRLYTYASLKADEDRRVAANQERKQQAQDVFTALGEATAWTNPEDRRARRAEGERAYRRRRRACRTVRLRLAR